MVELNDDMSLMQVVQLVNLSSNADEVASDYAVLEWGFTTDLTMNTKIICHRLGLLNLFGGVFDPLSAQKLAEIKAYRF